MNNARVKAASALRLFGALVQNNPEALPSSGATAVTCTQDERHEFRVASASTQLWYPPSVPFCVLGRNEYPFYVTRTS